MTQDIALVDTVENMKKLFTKRQLKDAALVRQAQMRTGYPCVKDIVEVLNLPITRSDLDNAERIGEETWGTQSGKPLARDHL